MKTMPDYPGNMNGRVCLVTGANSGIGKAIAQGLAAAGAHVLLVCRSAGRGRNALIDIQRATGSRKLTLLRADLSSQAEVIALANQVRRTVPALHVLINNAATIPRDRQVTEDGLEMQLAVNHLAPFLLTNLLLELLCESAPARIITISSQTHSGARIPFDDLQSTEDYQPSSVYAWTKLANILFTTELARRLSGTQVTANAVNPGVINTNLLHDYIGASTTGGRRLSRYGEKPDKGAETPLFLAMSSDVTDISGAYFRECRQVPASLASRDGAMARRLWDISAQLVNLN